MPENEKKLHHSVAQNDADANVSKANRRLAESSAELEKARREGRENLQRIRQERIERREQLKNRTPQQKREDMKDNIFSAAVITLIAALAFEFSINKFNRENQPPNRAVSQSDWTPEMQAADNAREACIVELSKQMEFSPPSGEFSVSPQRTKEGNNWVWNSITVDRRGSENKRIAFTCNIADGEVKVRIAQ